MTVTSLKENLPALANNPSDKEKLKEVYDSISSFLVGVFDDWTEDNVATIENGLLKLEINMVPMEFLFGLISLTRSKEDSTNGPIFSLQLPVDVDTLNLDPAVIGSDLLTSTKVQIEGYAFVAGFCYGSVKLFINKEGSKFYFEYSKMYLFNTFTASGIAKVTDSNEVHASGWLGTWFTADFAEKVASKIKDAAEPFIEDVTNAINSKKSECALLQLKPLIDACEAIIGRVSFLTDLAIGKAANAAYFIVKNIGAKIFEIKKAGFDVRVDTKNWGEAAQENQRIVKLVDDPAPSTEDTKGSLPSVKVDHEKVTSLQEAHTNESI